MQFTPPVSCSQAVPSRFDRFAVADAMALDVAPVVLPPAAEPIVLPVPPGAVKVMPRWAEEEQTLCTDDTETFVT